MIDIRNGELADILPSPFKDDIEIRCFSHALHVVMNKMLRCADRLMLRAAIDDMSENVLDQMAVEFRSLYYDQELPIEQKRELVKNALLWNIRAGTPSAMMELIRVVLGSGQLTEWPEYDEPPYAPGTFDLETNAPLRPETRGCVLDMLYRVKNVRSHLRRLVYKRESEIEWGVGLTTKSIPERYTASWPEEEREAGIPAITGAGFTSEPLRTSVPLEAEARAELETAAAFAAARYVLRIAQAVEKEASAALQKGTGGALTSLPFRLGQETDKSSEAALQEDMAGALTSLPFRLGHAPEKTAEAALEVSAGHSMETQAVRLTRQPDGVGSVAASFGSGFAAGSTPMRTSIRSPDRTARMTGRIFSGALTPIRLRTNA